MSNFIYRPDAAAVPGMNQFKLLPNSPFLIVPGSLRFEIGSDTFIDKGGGAIHAGLNPATGSSLPVGTVNYTTHQVDLIAAYSGQVRILSLLVYDPALPQAGVYTVYGRLPKAPIRLGSFDFWGDRLDGTGFTGSADNSGVIIGTDVSGQFEHNSGFFRLVFADPVKPQTLYFNATSYYYLPLESELIGIDTLRFPQDGNVPVFKRGDTVFLSRRKVETLPNPLMPGQTISLSETNLTGCQVRDALGVNVATTKYSANLALGEVTMANPLDLTGYVQPLEATWLILHYARAIEVRVSGEIDLSLATSHDFPAAETTVSSALLAGDRYARVTHVFSQQTWTEVWQDTSIDPINAQLNIIDYPIVVKNRSAIQQQWVGIVRNGSQIEIVGRTHGSLGVFSMQSDIEPVSQLTGESYFKIDRRAFGNLASWVYGNCIRFDTVAAANPFWTLRSLQPSAPITTGDGFVYGLISDVEP